MYLKLNRIQYPVYNLGPGKRIAIWVQGCSLACDGCLNPALWSTKIGKEVDVTDLAKLVVEIGDGYEGVTITGGEPFQQYEEMIAFCALVKRLTELDIFVYSGYALDELANKFPDQAYRSYIDFLMDGRYQVDSPANDNLRGSKNQKFYRFIKGTPVIQTNNFSTGKWSMTLTEDNELYMAGVPKSAEIENLTNRCVVSGISLRFS